MGRDKRIYRFVQDTRFGRIVLAESHDVPVIVDAVTDYVARRMIEREHALVATPAAEPVAETKPRRRRLRHVRVRLPRRRARAVRSRAVCELAESLTRRRSRSWGKLVSPHRQCSRNHCRLLALRVFARCFCSAGGCTLRRAEFIRTFRWPPGLLERLEKHHPGFERKDSALVSRACGSSSWPI